MYREAKCLLGFAKLKLQFNIHERDIAKEKKRERERCAAMAFLHHMHFIRGEFDPESSQNRVFRVPTNYSIYFQFFP